MRLLRRCGGCERRKTWLREQWAKAERWLVKRLLGKQYLIRIGVEEGSGLYLEGTLARRIIRADGQIEELPLLHNTITDAAADALANDFFDASVDVTAFDFHHWGTGVCTIPPACTATAMVTPGSEARVAGTASKPAVRQYRTVGTITADGAKTITEWSLWNLAAAGIAWSIRCFTGIPLALGDAIEFTYTLTVACVTG